MYIYVGVYVNYVNISSIIITITFVIVSHFSRNLDPRAQSGTHVESHRTSVEIKRTLILDLEDSKKQMTIVIYSVYIYISIHICLNNNTI